MRCPAESLQVFVDVLKESIVVPAKVGVLAVAEQVNQPLAGFDLPAVSIGESGHIGLIA